MHWLKRRTVWGATGLLVLLAVGIWFFRRPSDDKAVKYETSSVDKGRIVAKVTATGTLSALVTVQIGSQVSGRISELHADFNSVVKKGDVLARIDPQLFQAALEQSRANYAAAQGNVNKAKIQALDAQRQAQRSKSLIDRSLIAQADDDTAQANAEAAKAQVAAADGNLQQARAALNQAGVNLAYTTITSPIDGVVISRNIELGQTVAASLQAPVLFVLAEDLRKMQVDTNVAEADIGKLRDGMDAVFTVDAYPSERFKGKLRQIRNAPQTVQNVVTYNAIIDVENPELKLKPGMTATVTFIYADRQEVLRVPNAALRFKPPPGMMGAGPGKGPEAAGRGGPPRKKPDGEVDTPDRRTLYVLREGKPVAVPIRVGTTDGTVSEVIDGDLRSGDAVITEATVPGQPRPSGSFGGGGMRRVF